MAYEFRMPDLGEGVAEGEIVRWLVAVGEEVAEDDLLVEIQTDKATVEVPSPAAGVVSRILAEEGDVVPVGELLVVIGCRGRGTRYRTLGRDGSRRRVVCRPRRPSAGWRPSSASTSPRSPAAAP